MAHSRRVIILSVSIVAAGVVAALGAFVLDPARAAVGPLAAEALALPASAHSLVGIDVKLFTGSPFYRKYARSGGPSRPDAFAKLEEETGINPERDLDSIVIADLGGKGAKVVWVKGRFDHYKLGRAIETQKSGVSWTKGPGDVTVYQFALGGPDGAAALAFLDDDTLVMGSARAVEDTLDNRAQGRAALRSNTALSELLTRVKPGSTFWMVGDQSLLARMPTSLPAPSGAGHEGAPSGSLTLPTLRALVVTGDLDPEVALVITGEAADEAGAKNLGDVVRGLLAFASLQANQKPELRELASAVSVTTERNEVHVNARFPYALFDALNAKKSVPPAAQ